MKTIKYLSFLLVAAMLAATACTDLDVLPEGGDITIDQLRKTLEDNPSRSEAELGGLYSILQGPAPIFGTEAADGQSYPDDGGYPLFCFMTDLNAADIMMPSIGFNWFAQDLMLSDRDFSSRHCAIRWLLFYQQIKGANDLIKKIDENTEEEMLRASLGQAYALRAFDYMNLAPYYQLTYAVAADKPCVPIITENTTGSAFARNTVAEVYDQILSDLSKAEALLDGFVRSNKMHIDQSIVFALRANALLTMQRWSEAYEYAQKALDNLNPLLCNGEPYSLAEVSRPAFCNLGDHNWIWGLKITGSMIGTEYCAWPGWLGSFSHIGYSTAVGVYSCINTLLYNKIPADDVRRGWWVDEDLNSAHLEGFEWKYGSKTYTGRDIAAVEIPNTKVPYLPYTNVKFGFQEGEDLSKLGGDWCMLRVEELYYIKAECAAHLGKVAEAQDILNKMMSYRNPNYKQQCANILDEIWLQRRIEFWGEGKAFADMMRLQKPLVRFNNNVESNLDITCCFNMPANDPYLLMRFPDSELNANTAIVQNSEGNAPSQLQGASLRDGVTD